MTSRPVIDALVRLHERYAADPLVVLVPNVQQGHAVAGALARRTGQWHGLRAVTPAKLARTMADVDILTSGRSEVLPVGRLFYAAEILAGLAPSLQEAAAPGAHHLARTVSDAVQTLRLDAVSPDRLHDYAAEDGTDGTMQVVADGYERYTSVLDAHSLFDDATVYAWAEERVRASTTPGVGDTVFVLINSVELPQRAFQFVDALQEHGKAFFRTGASIPHRAPRESAVMRFPDAKTEPLDDPCMDGTDQSVPPQTFVRAVGVLSEADAVMRDILDAGAPFDEVTIAYTTARPYASLLPDRAARAGIPVRSSAGQPAVLTRTGRALHQLYDWIREDFAAPMLVSMLREGTLRLHGSNEDPANTSLSGTKAASMIAGRSYESGRVGLLRGLRRAVTHAADEVEQNDTETTRRRLHIRQDLFHLVLNLIDLFQPGTRREAPDENGNWIDGEKLRAPVTLTQMAAGSLAFLETYGPADDASDKPEDERSLDEVAWRRIYEELEDLRDNGVTLTTEAPRVASLLQKWLTSQNVQPQKAQSGHVQIMPLEAVGYDDRNHLYVVGMDSTAFDAPVGENGLLGEADRHILQELGADAREASLTAADELLWRTEQALARHRGPTTFYTRTFDVNTGEECDPSAFFLAKERRAGEDAVRRSAALTPAAGSYALSARDAWLTAYDEGRTQSTPPPETARDHLMTEHPRLVDGEAARRAKASETYTEHDGLLPAGTYPHLDLFAESTGPVSASRLQTLAEAPYIYFLKYVLGVRPLEEPALDDEAWLNSLRKGTLLHTIYERFVQSLDGRVPEPDDEPALLRIVDEALEEEAQIFEPSSEMVRQAARRELVKNARVFFRAEMDRDRTVVPEDFELGFGMPHQDNNRYDAAPLQIGDATLRVQGKIDRIDRNRETGALAIWDYKTGKAGSYDESEPLQDGKTLQWAIYAYALETLSGETVEQAGYFFANKQEVGARIGFAPAPYRSRVETILEQLRTLTQTGTFPQTPKMASVTDWKWNGYDRLVQDLSTRAREVRAKNKNYPDTRPHPPSF